MLTDLPRKSFSGDLLDRQIDHKARLFLAEARNFKFDHDEKVIYLFSTLQWYKEDFTDWYHGKCGSG